MEPTVDELVDQPKPQLMKNQGKRGRPIGFKPKMKNKSAARTEILAPKRQKPVPEYDDADERTPARVVAVATAAKSFLDLRSEVSIDQLGEKLSEHNLMKHPPRHVVCRSDPSGNGAMGKRRDFWGRIEVRLPNALDAHWNPKTPDEGLYFALKNEDDLHRDPNFKPLKWGGDGSANTLREDYDQEGYARAGAGRFLWCVCRAKYARALKQAELKQGNPGSVASGAHALLSEASKEEQVRMAKAVAQAVAAHEFDVQDAGVDVVGAVA